MQVTSQDGTRIGYETAGQGPPLLLVDGAFCSRKFGPMPALVPLLKDRFTVVTYDRRGRGESGDTPPHTPQREVEDLQALVQAVGGTPYVYGTSSGAVLALRLAAATPVKKLVLFEPPLVLDDAPGPLPPDRMDEVVEHARAGRRSDAVKAFLAMVGAPRLVVAIMRLIPKVWRPLTAVAHTLPYDLALLGKRGQPLPADVQQALAAVQAPTLVVVGGKSPPWMHHTVRKVAEGIRGAHERVVPGQGHDIAAKAMAPVLREFFAG